MSDSLNGAPLNLTSFDCPIPHEPGATVQLSHGGGGRLMRQLLEKTVVPALSMPGLQNSTDSATLSLGGAGRIAFTTDSYVIRPLFFPGGDIGSLAVHGTVNDLAMAGARPQWISLALIAEEGLPLEDLRRILESAAGAARAAGVQIVTGDTKVVDRGKGDGLYINTAGIGVVEHDLVLEPKSIREGDVVLLNGDVGRHGIAVMAVREGLEFETEIVSDSAPLTGVVGRLLDAGIEIRCMRDLTRGGLASGLNEIADSARLSITIDESAVPVEGQVQGACEILGFDPLYVANEGRFIVIVAEKDAERALEVMRADEQGRGAVRIGTVQTRAEAPVLLRGRVGVTRILDMLSGEQLPRIC